MTERKAWTDNDLTTAEWWAKVPVERNEKDPDHCQTCGGWLGSESNDHDHERTREEEKVEMTEQGRKDWEEAWGPFARAAREREWCDTCGMTRDAALGCTHDVVR